MFGSRIGSFEVVSLAGPTLIFSQFYDGDLNCQPAYECKMPVSMHSLNSNDGYRACFSNPAGGGGNSPDTRVVMAGIAHFNDGMFTDHGKAEVENWAIKAQGRDITVFRRAENSHCYFRVRSANNKVTIDFIPEFNGWTKPKHIAEDGDLDAKFTMEFTRQSVGDDRLFRYLQALPVAMLSDYHKAPDPKKSTPIVYPDELTHDACVQDRGNWRGRNPKAKPQPV